MCAYLVHSSVLYHACIQEPAKQTGSQSCQPRARAYYMSPVNTVFQAIAFPWIVFFNLQI